MNIGKKLLSLLTVFCLTLSLVPTVALAADATSIWFGYRDTHSVTLNSTTPYLASNSTQAVATQPNEATGYAYFTNGTLTLHNYNNSSTAGIFSGYYDLTIKLEGTNSIKSSDNGICTYKNLTISGPGSLSLTAAGNGTTVYAGGTLTINNGAKVSAPSGQSGQSFHVDTSNGRIIITGAGTKVNAIDSAYKRGIVRSGIINDDDKSYNGTIEVSDGAKLQATQIEGTLIVDGENSSLDSNKNEVSLNPVKKYVVSGKVTDGTSDIVGASVQLCSTTGTANAGASAVISTSATTESDGTYRFSNVPAGNYTITASKEGYSASTGASVNVTVSNSNVTTGTALTLSLIKYDVYVNGTQVTGINKDNVLSDSGTPTVVYTPAEGGTPQTLTLNGVNITNTSSDTHHSGIEASDNLIIALEGDNNTISDSGHAINMTNDGALTITGHGSLKASSDSGQTTVYTKGNVTINGGAKIIATNTSGGNGDVFDLGNSENKHTLTITGTGTQVIAQKTAGSAVAINHISTLTVNGDATLTAQSNGKDISCTTFSVNNSSAKVADNYAGTNAIDYNSNNNNLNNYNYVAVQPEGTTSATYTVTLTSGTGYTLSAAQGSSTTVTSGGSYWFTLNIANGYKRGNNFAVKANGSELTAEEDGKYTISNIQGNQTITVEDVVDVTKYQVWVNGTQVTEANKDNVLGDNSNSHSVIYTPANEDMPAILTLNNANIVNTQMPTSGGMYYISPNGITAKEDLKINVIGTNKIESKHGNPINATKNLTISDSNTANNSLELKSKDNMTVLSLDYKGPYNLIISGSVNVKAIVETNVIAATSVSANKMIIQDNAKVTAINHGKNMAIYCRDALTVKDSATLIAQSENNNHAVTVENGFTYPGHIIEASKNFAGTNPDETYNPEKLDPGVNKTGYRYVEVRPTSGTVITGIKLNKELSMKVGTTDTLTPVFTPANATEQTVTWTSSDKTIATVTNGKVTAVGVGTATITVLTKDGGYTDTCTVTVSNPSSSSGSHTTYYSVNTPAKSEGGSVVVSPKSASKGSAVTVTVTPESGYQVSSVQAVDKDGKKLTLTDKGDGKYSFVMPGSKVEVSASFAQVQKPEEASPYRDVSKDSYYYDAVQWASNKGITNGVADSVFAPDWVCTRGQIVTFLWRSVGSPAPKTAEMPFADVAEDAYYAQAVLWAVEKGITKGTSETTFSPDQTCTRAHAVAFLYRLAGSPAVTGSSFQDVTADAYYNAAVAWAVQQGITKGTSETTFSPNETCTRAQIVTFLYRMDQAK